MGPGSCWLWYWLFYNQSCSKVTDWTDAKLSKEKKYKFMHKFYFKSVPLILDMTSLKDTEVILLQPLSFLLLFIMYLPNHSTIVHTQCWHLGILFLILVENMEVRQKSSHVAEMAAVEFLFKETMNNEPWNSVSGSETQASNFISPRYFWLFM